MGNNKFDEFDLIEKEENCNSCGDKKKACISFFAHENDMMHKDMDNERSHRSNMFMCFTFIIITLIFVLAYTIRMNSFIDLIRDMNAEIVQLVNGKGIISP